MNWCVFVWCTQKVHLTTSVSLGISHVTTKQHSKYTTTVDIQKRVIKKASHLLRIAGGAVRQERSESARERRIALYKSVKSQIYKLHQGKGRPCVFVRPKKKKKSIKKAQCSDNCTTDQRRQILTVYCLERKKRKQTNKKRQSTFGGDKTKSKSNQLHPPKA